MDLSICAYGKKTKEGFKWRKLACYKKNSGKGHADETGFVMGVIRKELGHKETLVCRFKQED